MANVSAVQNYFSYVGGLVTEASPLNAPENTSFDEDNMDLLRNGTRKRRRGINREIDGLTIAHTHTANDFTTGGHVTSIHEWRSIGGDGALNKTLIQVGNVLHIRQLDTSVVFTAAVPTINNTAIAGGGADTSISLTLAKVGVTDNTPLSKVSISFGKGVAFVVGPDMEPFFVEYHADTGNFSTHWIGGAKGNILLRDFSGVDDGLAVDDRPAHATWAALVAANPNHAYNLLNQGWTVTHGTTYITASAVAPSNADVWWHGKNTTGVFTPAEMDKLWFGSMRGAQGHYIYTAFANTRSSIITAATDFATDARPSVTAFYSGRVWYSGIKDSEYSGTILYSKLVENPVLDAHKCHMEADPTSEIVSDLVATDGGTITIPEAGEIIQLIPAASGIIVLAKNGVWHVRGTTDTGFNATGFSVVKVTNIGCDAPESVVEVEGTVMYWNRAGIYVITLSPDGGNLISQNMTQETIQERINDVATEALAQVQGVYDPLEREVKWIYAETLDTYPEYCNKFLTLDLVLKAWYTGTVSGDNTVPFIIGSTKTLNLSPTPPNYESMIRFLTLKQLTPTTLELSVSSMYDERLVDWFDDDSVGINYSSFIESSQELMGDAMRGKSIDEVHTFFKRTEDTVTDGVLDSPSRCLMQYKFDWADDDASGKFTKKEEAYKFVRPLAIPSTVGTHALNYGHSVIVTKHNVRGNGRALQIRLESVDDNDIQLLGWAVRLSGTTR